MRDLHSHILPGIDDGAKTLDEAKALLDKALKANIDSIMLTPHFVEDSSFNSSYTDNLTIFEAVKQYANKIGIKIYLGNEVYINYNMVDLIKRKKITTLNKSRYLLIELPLETKFNDVKSLCFELKSVGITPIIAHPERYIKLYKNLDYFIDLRTKGVLYQINFPSLLGIYGHHAKKMAKILLKNGLVSFVGSDIHHLNEDKYDDLDKVIKKLQKYVGEDEAEKIMNTNFMKVVNNEEL